MKLDLRPRCKRCRKIPRGSIETNNYEKYYPGYCSFQCQQWHRLDLAREYLKSLPSSTAEHGK